MFSSKLSFIDHNSGDKGVLRLDAVKNTVLSWHIFKTREIYFE